MWGRGVLERQGYFAGSDERRLAELNEALRDPTASAIVAVRGGYGAMRICHAADFQSLATFPKWCVGFSDVTSLHLEALRAGVASLHASNLTGLGRADEATRERWVDAIERPLSRRVFSGLDALASGRADALAGRYLHAEHDDIDDLIRRVDEIRERDLNSIRLQR
jgi:muramoyltetrapeptide carboxypeptidase